jgi:hypothetical protein
MEASFIGLLKTTATDEFVGAPGVGPGVVVNGEVLSTRGRFVSAVTPAVMNCDTNGVVSPSPAALVGDVAVTV